MVHIMVNQTMKQYGIGIISTIYDLFQAGLIQLFQLFEQVQLAVFKLLKGNEPTFFVGAHLGKICVIIHIISRIAPQFFNSKTPPSGHVFHQFNQGVAIPYLVTQLISRYFAQDFHNRWAMPGRAIKSTAQ